MEPAQTELPSEEQLKGNNPSASQNADPSPANTVTSKWLKLLTLLSGVGLMAVGLWVLQQDWSKNLNWLPWGVLIAGFGVFLFGQRINPKKQLPKQIIKVTNGLLTKLEVKGWQLLSLLASPFLALVAFWAAGTGPYMNNPATAIFAWISAILLVVFGSLVNRPSFSIQHLRRVLVLPGLLILVAGIIRSLYLENIPILLSGDEASSGISAVAFINGDTDNIFRMGWYSFPAFHNWLQSIPIQLFGQNIPALRFTSVFAGSITVGVVYLVGKSLFGQRVGLYAGIFLSAYHFHHNFSRIGLNNIWDGLWFVSVLGTLWYGWQHDSRWAFILSGLALGFSQFFYVTSRVLLALIPAWLLITLLFDWPRFRKLWPHLILLGLTALVVMIPLMGYYIQNPNEFFAPMVRVSIMDDWLTKEMESVNKPGWLILLQQLSLSFLGLIHTPLRAWYTPGVPLLRSASATLFLIGLGILWMKPKDNRFHLLTFWILAICIPGGLSDNVPAAQRYVALAPALAILIGFGLDQVALQITQLTDGFKGISYLAAFLVILIISVGELNFYYFKYTPTSEFGGANSLVAQRLADTLQSRSDQWEVIFWGYPRMGYYSIPSLQYLAPDIKGLDMNHPWGSDKNPQPTSDYQIFVFLPDHKNQIKAVQKDYPGGKLIKELDRYGKTLYWLYEVTPDAQSHLKPQP